MKLRSATAVTVALLVAAGPATRTASVEQLRRAFVASFGDDFDECRTRVETFEPLGTADAVGLGTVRVVDCFFTWNESEDEAARHGTRKVLLFRDGRLIGYHRVDEPIRSVTLDDGRLTVVDRRGGRTTIPVGATDIPQGSPLNRFVDERPPAEPSTARPTSRPAADGRR